MPKINRKAGFLHRDQYRRMKTFEKRRLKHLPKNARAETAKVTSIASRILGFPDLARALESHVKDGSIQKEEAHEVLNQLFQTNLEVLDNIYQMDAHLEGMFEKKSAKELAEYINIKAKKRKSRIELNDSRSGQKFIIEY